MTYEEVKAAVEQWPVAEQLRLVEEVSRSVRATPEPDAAGGANGAWQKEFEADRARLLKDIPPESSAHRTFGMLRSSAHPPTDEEIREDYTDYLSRKYS